jgi:hypothetical protein
MTLPQRFIEKCEVASPGCWIWTGAHTPRGYGQWSEGGRKVYAYRFAYEQLIGPIPAGLQIDHLCRNPACVNPDHLEPVTSAENLRRSPHSTLLAARNAARGAAKTHCVNGHELSEENTYRQVRAGRVHRSCRTCRTIRDRRPGRWKKAAA